MTNAPSVTVTLKAGFLARDVRLAPRRSPLPVPPSFAWRVVAVDHNGTIHEAVTVNDLTPPPFDTEDSALAYMATLAASGVDVTRVFATPAEHVPRAYLVPSHGAAFNVRPA